MNRVNVLLDEMAPVRKLTKKESSLQKCPWMTSGLLKSIKTGDTLHKKYTKEKVPEKRASLHSKYKAFRNKTLTLLRQSKNNYYMNFFETNQKDMKTVWKEIRQIVNIKKKSGSVSHSFKIGNEYIDNPKRIADEFNNHFSSIGKKIQKEIKTSKKKYTDYLGNPSNRTLKFTLVTEEEVLTTILSLNTSKSCGPYSIPTNLLRTFSGHFVHPLTHIINLCLVEGIFPRELKHALVIALHKKSDKNKFTNYRPISLLSNIGKLFEKIVHARLYQYIQANEYFYQRQFGFRTKHSTSHALSSMTEFIKRHLKELLSVEYLLI